MPAASLEGEDSIFDAPGFKRLGAFFWPDYWKTVAHNPVWQIIGVQCRDEWEQEAGQMLIDKSRHLDVLHLTNYMMLRYKTWFHLSDGDKDLFRCVAHLRGLYVLIVASQIRNACVTEEVGRSRCARWLSIMGSETSFRLLLAYHVGFSSCPESS